MHNSPEALAARRERRKTKRRAASLILRQQKWPRCLHCPEDPVILRPLWRPGALLDPGDFAGTVADCAFPWGSVWWWPETGRAWRVQGNELHPLNGDGAVLLAVELQHRVKLHCLLRR